MNESINEIQRLLHETVGHLQLCRRTDTRKAVAWDHAEELDHVIVAAVKIEKEAPADGANGPAREPAEGAAAALGRD